MESLTQMDENIFDSMIFFRSWYEVAKEMNDSEFRTALSSLIEYALDGTEPSIENKTLKMFFMMAKPSIDNNIKHKLSGSKGGRGNKTPAKKGKSKSKPKEEPKPEPEPEEVKPEETQSENGETYMTDGKEGLKKWRAEQEEQKKREK